MTGYVEPTPHEFAANYLFDANELAPFFAADSQVKSGGGSQRSEFYSDRPSAHSAGRTRSRPSVARLSVVTKRMSSPPVTDIPPLITSSRWLRTGSEIGRLQRIEEKAHDFSPVSYP